MEHEIKPASSFIADGQSELFARVSFQLIDDERIGALEKALFLLLARHANWQTGMAFPGYRSMLRRLHCSKSSIRPAMQRLMDLDYLTAETTPGKRFVYTLKMPPVLRSTTPVSRSTALLPRSTGTRFINKIHLTSKSAVREHPEAIRLRKWQAHVAAKKT